MVDVRFHDVLVLMVEQVGAIGLDNTTTKFHRPEELPAPTSHDRAGEVTGLARDERRRTCIFRGAGRVAAFAFVTVVVRTLFAFS